MGDFRSSLIFYNERQWVVNMKKFIITLLSVICIISSVSLVVYAEDGGFGVEDDNGEWTTETHTDIFHTFRYDNNLLYPGSGSTYKFKVHNSGEKYDACSIKIEDKNEYKIPLEFKLKRNGEYIIGTETSWHMSPMLDTGLYKLRGTEEYELEWRWQYLNEDESKREEDNKRDTSLGEAAYVSDKPYYLNITVYGEGGTDESIPDDPSNPDEPEPEPSNPESEPESEPSNPSTPWDVVLTGDNLWKTCTISGVILGISCILIAVTGGKKDDKNKKE